MGWDIDRFPEGEVNLELICCICTCILEDPVESPCRHVFCSQCIKTWLSNQKSCPSCRAPVHKKDLQPVVPLLRNIISKQRIFCDNKERGCEELIPLEMLPSHVASCLFGLVPCVNEGCSVKVMRKDYKAHSEICLKRTVMCEHGCEMFLTLGEKHGHNCIRAMKTHFQDTTNELLSRVSKLEELVNMLVSKSNNPPPRPTIPRASNSNNTGSVDTIVCSPFHIPSPRHYTQPYNLYDTQDNDNTINLTNYPLENLEYSDSLESLESDLPRDVLGEVSPGEREMSPVYETRAINPPQRGRDPTPLRPRRNRQRQPRPRSRSPHSPFTINNTRNTINRDHPPARDPRIDRAHHSQRNFPVYETAEPDTTGRRNEEPLVLRIGVSSQTVSDSSSSSTSSSSDSEDE